MRKVLFGAAVLLVLLVMPAPANPEYEPWNRVVEKKYDPACDINRDGKIDIVDIIRVAALWRTTGTWSCPCCSIPKTGQSLSFYPGDDGDLQRGMAWPNPRFMDNGDGTVTDNLTGLIWLKNANCFGTKPWVNALSIANGLASGSCGLTDGSVAGDWRLPNVREMMSLIHFGVHSPAVPDTAGTGRWTEGNPFTDIQSGYYWSSTSYAYGAYGASAAWRVSLHAGGMFHTDKEHTFHLWPVRGGFVGQVPMVAPVQADPEYDPACDIDCDGKIDIVDIMRVAALWETTGIWSCPCCSVPKTGQSLSFYPGDDGDLQRGMAWPNPRFTDNGDGTVTDNLTGLIWLKNANCFGDEFGRCGMNWADALSAANTLNSGECDLSDGSVEGDWRLPNLPELQSLLHYGCNRPALPDTAGTGCGSGPFTGVQSDYYWSSTTRADATFSAWLVWADGGHVVDKDKTSKGYGCVWPVRGGL